MGNPRTNGEHRDAPAPKIRYVPALDGLRGLAVICVVAFHVGHLKGGYLGVDLFFVLSGFLITSLLVAEGATTNRIGLVRFWGRRARRLLPALAVMLLGVAAYAKLAAFPSELHRIRWDGIATMLYVANWREVFTKVDYWTLFVSPSPLNHTWSLAIEEQFYLVWPVIFLGLVAIARRHSATPRRLATITLVTALSLGVASLAISLLVGSGGSFDTISGGDAAWNRVYFGTDTRAFAILAGAAVAAGIARFGLVTDHRWRIGLEAAGATAALGLGLAWFQLDQSSSFLRHGGLAVCSLAAAVVIVAASHPDRKVLGRALSWRPLRWMGLISYGVYLYHWPIIVWCSRERIGLEGFQLIGVQVGATLITATLSYFVIEQPIRHGARWPRPMTAAIPTVAFASIGAALVISTAGALPLQAPRVPVGVTKPTPSPDGPRIMVIGDSVADFIASEGLVYLRAKPQPKVLDATVQGCGEPPAEKVRGSDGVVGGFVGGLCDNGWQAKAKAFGPDQVLYTTIGVTESEYWHDGRWLYPCSEGFHDWVVERISKLADRFASLGAHLVVATTVPSDTRGMSRASYREYQRVNGCWNDSLRDAAAHHGEEVTLVDLAARLCPGGRVCRLQTSDGSVAREDGAHFRGRAAQIVAKIILDGIGIDAELPK